MNFLPANSKLKMTVLIVLSMVLIGVVALTARINGWRQLPQGRLTLPSALIAKVAEWQEVRGAGNSIQGMRASRAKAIRFFNAPPVPMHQVRDLKIEGPGGALPLRIYTPQATQEAKPIVLYYHGGGWVLGNFPYA